MPSKEPYQHSAMFPVRFTYELNTPISCSHQTPIAGPILFTDFILSVFGARTVERVRSGRAVVPVISGRLGHRRANLFAPASVHKLLSAERFVHIAQTILSCVVFRIPLAYIICPRELASVLCFFAFYLFGIRRHHARSEPRCLARVSSSMPAHVLLGLATPRPLIRGLPACTVSVPGPGPSSCG